MQNEPAQFEFRTIDEIERAQIKRGDRFNLILGLVALVLLVFDDTFAAGLVLMGFVGAVAVLARVASWRRRMAVSRQAGAVSLEPDRVVLPAAPHSKARLLALRLDEVRAVYLQLVFGHRSLVIEHVGAGRGGRTATKYRAAQFLDPNALDDLQDALLSRLREAGLHEAVERSERHTHFFAARRGWLPLATLAALLVLSAAFVVQSAAGATVSSRANFFAQVEQGLRIGAFSRHLVEQGQLFRLVVPAFWHDNLEHLLGNLFAIAVAGGVVEWTLGRTRWFVVLTACAVASYVGLTFFDTTWFGVGASGVGYGFVGALAVVWLKCRRRLPASVAVAVAGVALVAAMATALATLVTTRGDLHAGIEAVNFAHVAGVVAGALVIWVFFWRGPADIFNKRAATWTRRAAALCGVLLVASLVWAAVYSQSDAYIDDVNAVVLTGIEDLHEIDDDQRVTLLNGFARARLARESADKAELEAARELLDRARVIDPSHEESLERADEVRARLDGL